MRPTLLRLALPIVLIALALPATALAQSAGDEQYADPFGNSNPKQQKAPSTAQKPAQSNQQTAQSNPGSDPTPPAATTSGTSSGKPTAGKQLPMTGLPTGVIAALGMILLVAGYAARSRLRPLVPSLLGRGPETLGRDILLTRRPPRR